MPVKDLISPFIVTCSGGLNLDTPVLSMPPGSATELINMEPDIDGGYRRIDGFDKFSTTELTGTGGVLGVAVLGANVIGCRGPNVEYGSGTTWTSIDTNRTSASTYTFDKYNWTGTEILTGADQVNYAFTWDGSTYTLLNGAVGSGSGTAPTAPNVVVEHRGRLFMGGYTNLAGSAGLLYTAPYAPNDFTPGSGAGEINLGDTFVTAKSFRENLFVFCENSIYRLSGSSPADYKLEPIARSVGCVSAQSVQEIAGDLVFLSRDGLRTIAGTAKIGDVALDNVSKHIQPRLKSITTSGISSAVIKGKTQYRIFFPVSGDVEAESIGVIGGLRSFTTADGASGVNWEFGDLRGIKPSCMTSEYIGDTEYVIHGDYDGGYVYRQENGNDFDGDSITSKYRSPDFLMGSPGLRKTLQRINLNYKAEGVASFQLYVKLDYEDINSAQPDAITITEGAGVAVYGTAKYGTDKYGSTNTPLVRRHIVGSGFAFAIEIRDTSTNPAFSIKGYEIEAVPGGRR